MTWSYSRITTFEDCPYKWFLTYIHGGIEKKTPFFAEYGSFMHTILQMYFSGDLRRKELSTFYVMNFKQNIRSSAPNQKIYRSYFEQGFQYLDSISFPRRSILGVEKRVNFKFAGRPFTGFIDVVSDDGSLIITDHKSRTLKPRSGRKKPTKTDLELDDYFRQLYVYSAAIREQFGKYPDFLEFNCFRSQTLIREPFEQKQFERVESWASQQIDKIVSNDYWGANPDYWRCNYLCDICADCEYWQSPTKRR